MAKHSFAHLLRAQVQLGHERKKLTLKEGLIVEIITGIKNLLLAPIAWGIYALTFLAVFFLPIYLWKEGANGFLKAWVNLFNSSNAAVCLLARLSVYIAVISVIYNMLSLFFWMISGSSMIAPWDLTQ